MRPRTAKEPAPAAPCVWIQDLDDILSPSGQQAVARIRATCQCEECTRIRQATAQKVEVVA